MKELTDAEIKSVQIEILQAVHAYCQNHCINYSLAYGTLIGAIRHKGFIPWDDDIDIMMLRDDYDKLVEGFNKENGRYRICTYKNTKGYPFPFAKVEDTKTIKSEVGFSSIGMAIDVFPVDNAPDNEDERKRFAKKSKRLWLLNQFKSRSWILNGSRSLINSIVVILIKLPLSLVSYSILNSICEKHSQSYNTKDSNWCMFALDCPLWAKSDFKDYIDVDFEGYQFKSIKAYDSNLRTIYGNYMELPPIEQQVTHHEFIAYWKDQL